MRWFDPITFVMFGSDSDLPQAHKGLKYFAEQDGRMVGKFKVYTNSIHRNTLMVLFRLLLIRIISIFRRVNGIITAAGMANQLSGTVDAFLRYTLKSKIPVYAVACTNKDDPESMAAILSIKKVPGNQLIFDNYVGEDGFYRACKELILVAVGFRSPQINVKPGKKTENRSLGEAIAEAEKLQWKETAKP